jgi:hypothetical protein
VRKTPRLRIGKLRPRGGARPARAHDARARPRRWPSRAILLLSSALAACSVSAEVGSAWLASQTVSPANGGAVVVTAAQSSALAGASLQVPPGALAEDAQIGVSPGATVASGDWLPAGPAVDWDPNDLALLAPVAFALPAVLPDGRSPDELLVVASGPAGDELLTGPELMFDGVLLHFSALHLGTFQAAVGKQCSDRDDCAPGDECDHGVCRPGEPADAGPPHR